MLGSSLFSVNPTPPAVRLSLRSLLSGSSQITLSTPQLLLESCETRPAFLASPAVLGQSSVCRSSDDEPVVSLSGLPLKTILPNTSRHSIHRRLGLRSEVRGHGRHTEQILLPITRPQSVSSCTQEMKLHQQTGSLR